MIRYEEVDDSVVDLAFSIITEYFPEIADVKIKYLFNNKKSISHRKLVLGKCQKPNELAKHFSIEDAGDTDGYQYVITLDHVAYDSMDDADRIRLLRHELRHVLVDKITNASLETEIKYRINPHNIEDFVEEIELNADNPDWARKAGRVARKIYKQK